MASAWDDEDTDQYTMPQQPRLGRPNSDRRGKERKKDTRLTREKFEEYLGLDPNEILIQLTRANGGLKSFLGNGALDSKLIPVAMKSFSKACQCELAEEEKNHLLSCILDSPFIDQLMLYYFHDTVTPELLENTMEVMLSIMRKMPAAGKNKIDLLLQIIGKRDNLGEESTRKLQDIRSILKTIPDSNEGIRQRRPDNDNDAPPEDFRNLTIIPRACDIDVSKEPFLRKNKTNDRYDNHDHYLDVQFRLLREDLIAPLRESISEFRSHGSNTERSTLKAYLKVRLVRPVCRLNGLGYRISFDTNQIARVNWDTSRRLIHGSLLCLSTDNFQTCVYATVVNREIDNIKNGLIDVCFEFSEVDDLNDFVDSNQSSTFVMVESPSYFEPYKHVLIAMQRMGENNFSFYRYIVEGAKDVYPPAYLRQNVTLSYDLRPLADNGYRFADNDDGYTFNQKLDGLQEVDILDDAAWPTADELNLDQSQSVAFRNALCREFAIIQGPPGTGKTHLGLNILKILLHNRNIWQTDENKTPIVVICYTNHALDQFLCGALDFFDGKMVRVGSRSKNEKIKEFSITNHRIRSRQLKQVSQAVHVSRYNMKIELDNLKKEIELNAVQLEIAQREIIQESCFKDESIIEDMHFQQLKSRNGLLHWLGIQNDLEKIHDIPPQAQHGLEQDQFEDSESDEGVDDTDELQMSDFEDMRLLDDDDLVGIDAEVEVIKSSITALNVSQLDNLIIANNDMDGKRKRVKLRYLKQSIRKKISSAETMTKDEVNGVADLRKLKYPDRWRLYRYWIRIFVKVVMEKLKDKELQYGKLAKRYNEIMLIEDKDIMQNATIVGLTTTGAARYQAVLADIGPKIVIFEEAAEVLEGHIVVNLCKKCEHAIFIGDHKQLRPNPTVHKLAKEFNLEISLFERLIGNNIPYDTLKLQHRMRPEISTIIHSIYPDLKDHDVVKNYEDILGVDRNIYFISHCQPDEVNCETTTRVNQFEGKYLKALCKYLMNQGYRPQRITILATYSGQQHYLSSIMRKEQYKNVRIATVDSYQGQENDIILLSLVRSSQEDGIGFLSQNNRLCVAFSRAKMGFYVIGNFEHLQKHSPLIKEMTGKAHKNKIIDECLPLSCPIHGFLIKATQPGHFKISSGGCKKQCNTRLKCGHQCTRICHGNDRNHQDVQCSNKCVRQCDNSHPCQKLCFEICGPCMIPMTKTIPRCGHEVDVPCSEEPWKAKCTATMTKTLPCGHKGKGICSPLLETKCMAMVEVDRERCGHKIIIPCHEKDSSKCNHLCGETLKCGHDCKGTCGDCYKGKLHMPCQERCGRTLICGHICLDACSVCPPCYQSCINKCKHNECTNKCGEPCIPCNEGCKWRCRHHVCTKRCSELCDRVKCDEPCRKLLACGHQCIGLCGEYCGEPGQQICRVCDRDKLEDLHIWGEEDVNVSRYIYLEDCCHIFEVNGLDKLMETDPTADSEIGIKRCPMCNTMIIKTSRYGNIVKKALQHVHNIKTKIVGASVRIADLKKKIEEKRRVSNELRSFIQRIYGDDEIEAENKLRAVVSQISIYENITSRCQQLDNTRRQLGLDEDYFKTVLVFVHQMKEWVSIRRTLFSEQEVHDAKAGLKKLKNWVILSVGRARTSDKVDKIPAQFMGRLASAIREMETDHTIPDDDMTLMIETIEQYIPRSTLGITDQERLNIVAAIGGRKGQWYQCRNGHYYSIGDCGRPDGTANCPECHEIIGGENHALHAGNIEAPEMDDAQGPLHTEESDYLYALQLQFE
ncbi:NFX1-type zinc finger-containing protein 1 [Patella vulgata]|uniref:NFX1-type zinc finger-containing protein 1 n=1 Tax=Patella vulgata TaxID=6465 RepID=UPI0024A9A87A|nr:NFX1-type zinc finger-containing protein 1 [Patella vulgata]